jgi:DnaJ-domain-containing protein 1
LLTKPPHASSSTLNKPASKPHDAPTVVALVMLAKAFAFPSLNNPTHAITILKQSYVLNTSTLRYIGRIVGSGVTDVSEINYALTQLKIEGAGKPEKLHAMLSCLLDLAVDARNHLDRMVMETLQQIATKLGYASDDFAALATIKGYLPDAIYDPYQILGLPTGASLEAASKAYKRLVQEFHPDRWHGKNNFAYLRAQERTVLINDAYLKIKKAASA